MQARFKPFANASARGGRFHSDLATFMELDTSIANVSLPYIARRLGRSFDEVTWILTTYLVANAVVLP